MLEADLASQIPGEQLALVAYAHSDVAFGIVFVLNLCPVVRERRHTKILGEAVEGNLLRDSWVAVETLIEITQFSEKPSGKAPALEAQPCAVSVHTAHALSQTILAGFTVTGPHIHRVSDAQRASKLLTVVHVTPRGVVENGGKRNCGNQVDHWIVLSG